MRKFLLTTAVAAAVLTAGCSAESADRQGGSGSGADRITDVDRAEVFRNIDDYPNVERVCIDGVAFAATTSYDGTTASNLIRVPEWDAVCGGGPAQ